ncbi:2,3-bisphosphoglycerate-independent phosphoglycerate mutase [Endozoicomonas sp. SCSIO W0465]|uniref:2,3-bisphosphoglycerate-independent phosphoglycerate mutase n=1 Tax=Endozoicomonas sp. SCSIO W0465 TaxID=2918516 RepID=UPI002075BD61|nr:2,3-bisphosphoglycerate-independent phosphoglycerate mutase [Endozoicomonas sp. SCSIO W0465]USE37022.1 2,3-bisphosphoglycerate-independent phosphoglycerate mutase [Endozoicomonas sp. SCSIO W0465]
MTDKRTPTALIILDGYGYREEKDSNAILAAKTPVMDRLWQENPHSFVSGSGMDVGLPDGQMGNSEVGHMNLGAGRVVYQELTRITKAIQDGDFYENDVITGVVDKAINAGKAVHIMGLVSPGGVHSHEDHIHAMVELAARRGAKAVYVHAFLDGRDTPPRSAESSLEKLDALLQEKGIGRVASLIGRYYAMDRDNRWDRVQQAYDLITDGKAEFSAATAVEGLQAAYERDENDEFVKATVIGTEAAHLDDGDALVFMNFRADRAREITRAFVDRDFDGFQRSRVADLAGFVMLTQYAADIHAPCAFPPSELVNTLGEYMEKLGKTQLRIAETEKYAHVTFFFSGGREEPFDGEKRVLVASPKVATYDLQPEMSAPEVTDRLVQEIRSGEHDLIICNYANCDMVGHTGDFNAAVKAVEAVDASIGRVVATLEEVGGQCLITADHGNAEQMEDPATGQAHTAHTCELVPLVYAGPQAIQLKDGILSDLAPTLLALMGLEQPAEMSGKSLLVK